jgi:hypothetical protein
MKHYEKKTSFYRSGWMNPSKLYDRQFKRMRMMSIIRSREWNRW